MVISVMVLRIHSLIIHSTNFVLINKTFYGDQWRIQDFPDEGRGANPIIWVKFSPKTTWKMKEIGWTGGWGSLRTHLRSWIRNIFHRLDILFCKRRKRQGPQFRDGHRILRLGERLTLQEGAPTL